MDSKPKLTPEAADIFRRLDELGLKQRDLAAALSLEENKISKAKVGERQFKAAEVLRSREWFASVEAKRVPPPKSDHLPLRKAEDGSIPLRHLDMSLSMGDGSSLDNYFEEGVFEFDANLLRLITRAPPERLIVGQGVGDSMFPTLHDQDMVIFDTTQTHLNATDKIWAISLFGAGGIKRLRPVSRSRVLIMSDNPSISDQEVDADDLRILGRVIWSARRH
ncbi:MAG TPA: S24 family peptidase [Sphingobium sp.]|uniref:S24 family peptidase n=1 Tax=Sphingobium sp. TaxID=1912891 RepID=UPI002ED3BA53